MTKNNSKIFLSKKNNKKTLKKIYVKIKSIFSVLKKQK